MSWIKEYCSGIYLWAELFFVIFVFAIAFSPWGKIRLGDDTDKPEYSTISWFAMLFAAGMGIGLVFWGIAEPLSHYVAPMGGIESRSAEAAAFSMRSCFMHWGLQPWVSYSIVGLGLAYFQFRKKDTVLVSNLTKPLLGEKAPHTVLGHTIDVLTTVVTVIGVSTSFGMGCIQISSGLDYLYGIPENKVIWAIIIIIVTACFMTSAVKGLDKGIKLLSNFNLILCLALVALVFYVGPHSAIITSFFTGLKDYAINFVGDSIRMKAPDGSVDWIRDWRVFYWAWWISWVPFVGTFIARISRGRTIRQFLLCATLVPTIVSCIWFAVFGGVAIEATQALSSEVLSDLLANPQTALFYVFEQYPLASLISIVAMVLCILFYITSADSATFVLGMLTDNGNPNPSTRLKVFWGVVIAAIAYAMITNGGISSIQTLSIIMAFPYVFIMLLVCLCLVLAFMKDHKK